MCNDVLHWLLLSESSGGKFASAGTNQPITTTAPVLLHVAIFKLKLKTSACGFQSAVHGCSQCGDVHPEGKDSSSSKPVVIKERGENDRDLLSRNIHSDSV